MSNSWSLKRYGRRTSALLQNGSAAILLLILSLHHCAVVALSRKLLENLSPDCNLWTVDGSELLLTNAEGTHPIHIQKFGGTWDDTNRATLFAKQWDALGLGYGGLRLGSTFVIDLWFLNAFVPTQPAQDDKFHALLAGGYERHKPQFVFGFQEAVGELVFKALLSTPGGDDDEESYETHPTGIKLHELPIKVWHQLTIAGTPQGCRLFINQAEAGHAPVKLDAVQVVGNTGGGEMKAPWGSWVARVTICTGVPVATQLSEEKEQMGDARDTREGAEAKDTDWVIPLQGKRVVLVGNSQKLVGVGKGPEIDGYDAIFRFNALQLSDQMAPDMGKRVTHDVLGDMTQLCGCSDGECCKPYHIHSMRMRYLERDSIAVIYANKRNDIPESIQMIAGPHIALHRLGVKRHAGPLVNVYLDKLQRTLRENGRPEAAAALTFRIPQEYGFRSGFRIIFAMLLEGISPALVGFDLDEENNKLFTGRMKWPTEPYKYLPETRVLKQLVEAGVIANLG
eukprot:jgi/Mesvir1/27567/Mv07313-RA.1